MLVRILALFLALLVASPAYAGIATKPNTFVAGQTLPAASLNSNFDVLYSEFNGNIENINIKSGAALDPAKFDLTKAYGPILRSATNTIFSGGVTADTQPRIALTADGFIYFGPGSSTVLDLLLRREDSSTFAFRNADDDADADIQAGSVALSGSLSATDRTTSFNNLAPSSPSKGDILVYDSVAGNWVKLTNAGAGDDGKLLALNSANDNGVEWSASGSGTVTSFSATPTGVFDVADGTTTPALSLDSQNQNIVLASPDSSSGTPGFRALVNNDLPTVGAAKGGTGQTSYTKGDILVATGSTTLVKLGVGADGTSPIADSGEASGIRWGSVSGGGSGIGGNGDDGAVTQGNGTETNVRSVNSTSFTMSSFGVVYNVVSGSMIQATGKIDLADGDIVVGAAISGPTGASTPGRDGGGIGGGKGSTDETQGAGGGGFGGAGGDGDGADRSGGLGGVAHKPDASLVGGAGGSGSWDTSNTSGTGGSGGDAGGSLRLTAADDTSTSFRFRGGQIIADGGDGAAGTGGTNTCGGAGGSGGFVGAYSIGEIDISSASSILARGGDGGNGQGTGVGGSGGGGGYVILYADVIDTNEAGDDIANAVDVSGGSAGTGGSSGAGTAGVKFKVIGVPSLPLIADLEKPSTFQFFRDVYQFTPNNTKTGISIEMNQRSVASAMAALYAPPGQFEKVRTALIYAPELGAERASVSCEAIGDLELLPAA